MTRFHCGTLAGLELTSAWGVVRLQTGSYFIFWLLNNNLFFFVCVCVCARECLHACICMSVWVCIMSVYPQEPEEAIRSPEAVVPSVYKQQVFLTTALKVKSLTPCLLSSNKNSQGQRIIPRNSKYYL